MAQRLMRYICLISRICGSCNCSKHSFFFRLSSLSLSSVQVYCYYKSLPVPITSHKFGPLDRASEVESGSDDKHFVSSVCWGRRTNMVVAANSAGTLKVLEMV